MIWKAYFEIFPMREERMDERVAVLASTIMNSSGRQVKNMVSPELFMPDYLHERAKATPKNIEHQTADAKAFRERLLAEQAKLRK